MRKAVIALVTTSMVGIAALAATVPVAAQAHWRPPHRASHHGWRHAWPVGPSYYPIYGYFDDDPYGPVCVWRREWDAYWHRDCF
jgi:hypothetical protein